MMKKIYTIATVVLLSFNFAGAQYAHQQTLYNNLPQAKYTNPGILPEYNGYFAIPALSGYGITASNSGFTFNDLFQDGNVSPNNLLSSIQNKNLLNFGTALDAIALGVKFGKNFVSFNLTPKTDFNLGYSKSVFDFLINGNAAHIGKTISLDGFSFDFSAYVETGIGYTREINEKISVGGRLKLLSGLANASGNFDGISLYTDPNDYSLTATSNFAINGYGTFFADSLIAEQMGNPPAFNINNLGLGIDFGANYQFSENLQLFASVIDLGYIRWSEYGETLYNEGASFKFEGMPMDDLFNTDDNSSNDESNSFDNIVDTIAETFNLQRSQIGYSTGLKTKIYAGASYSLTDYFNFQGMLYGRVFNNKLYPMYMFSGGVNLKKWFSAKLTYSGTNKTYDNIGAGFVLHLGAVQLYAMMDNVFGLTQIDYTRNLSGSFGLNFAFKNNDDKKLKRAKEKKKKAERKKEKAEDKKEKAEDKKEKAESKKEKELKSEIKQEKSDAKEIKKEAKSINEKEKELKSEIKQEKSDAKEIKKETKSINENEKELKSEKKQEKSDAKEIKKEAKSINEKEKELKSETKQEKSELKEIKVIENEKTQSSQDGTLEEIPHSEIVEKDSVYKSKLNDIELFKDSVPVMTIDSVGIIDSLKLSPMGGGL